MLTYCIEYIKHIYLIWKPNWTCMMIISMNGTQVGTRVAYEILTEMLAYCKDKFFDQIASYICCQIAWIGFYS